MKLLRKVFDNVPDYERYIITAWKSDEYALGSYSFVATGGTGDDYDALAKPVGDRVFFAGEATCRQHPATVLGAYLSGHREAGNIDRLYNDAVAIDDNSKKRKFELEQHSTPQRGRRAKKHRGSTLRQDVIEEMNNVSEAPDIKMPFSPPRATIKHEYKSPSPSLVSGSSEEELAASSPLARANNSSSKMHVRVKKEPKATATPLPASPSASSSSQKSRTVKNSPSKSPSSPYANIKQPSSPITSGFPQRGFGSSPQNLPPSPFNMPQHVPMMNPNFLAMQGGFYNPFLHNASMMGVHNLPAHFGYLPTPANLSHGVSNLYMAAQAAALQQQNAYVFAFGQRSPTSSAAVSAAAATSMQRNKPANRTVIVNNKESKKAKKPLIASIVPVKTPASQQQTQADEAPAPIHVNVEEDDSNTSMVEYL